jgi:hypothetical protein
MSDRNQQDLIAGFDGVLAHDDHSDTLLSNKVNELSNPQETTDFSCIKPFLEVTPFEFKDELFVKATLHLDGFAFARAAYLVYLRRDCEIHNLNLGIGYFERTQAISRFRQSYEFIGLWAEQVEKERRRRPLQTFLQRTWVKITG